MVAGASVSLSEDQNRQEAPTIGVVIVTFISAVAGTWVYGRFREKLPH